MTFDEVAKLKRYSYVWLLLAMTNFTILIVNTTKYYGKAPFMIILSYGL